MADTLPILYDPVSKKIVLLDTAPKDEWKDLLLEITQLNTITNELVSLNADVPPIPTKESFNKNLSQLCRKVFESGSKSFKEKRFADAVKQFSVAVEITNRRPKFESFQLTLQDTVMPLMARCDSYLMSQDYINAFGDADVLCSIAANVPDNHLRRGIANYKLGNLIDAKNDFERGLLFAPTHPKLNEELKKLLQEISLLQGEDYYLEVKYAEDTAAIDDK